MRIPSKKIIFCSFFFFSLAGFVFAQRELEVPLPGIGGEPGITQIPILSQYVKYLFTLGIAISGLIALGVIIYAGFRYLTSVGNPSVMSDAKDRIYSAAIGLVILLASYLLLTTINPQLLVISPTLAGIEKGIVVFKDAADCKPNFKVAMLPPEKREGQDYAFLKVSRGNLVDFNNKVKAVYFYQSESDLGIKLYDLINYGNPISFINPGAGQCLTTLTNLAILGTESIELIPKGPGVYLCQEQELRTCLGPLTSDLAGLGELNDKVKYVRFQNPKKIEILEAPSLANLNLQCSELGGKIVGSTEFRNGIYLGNCEYTESKYGTILFEHDKFGEFKQSVCKVYLSSSVTPTAKGFVAVSLPTCGRSPCEISSAMIFTENLADQGNGVTLWENIEYDGQSKGPFKPSPGSSKKEIPDLDFKGGTPRKDLTSSIEIEGNFYGVLFGDIGFEKACQVYKKSDPNVDNEPIREDTASSLQVIGVK